MADTKTTGPKEEDKNNRRQTIIREKADASSSFSELLECIQSMGFHKEYKGRIEISVHTLQTTLVNEASNPNFHVRRIEGITLIRYEQQLPSGAMVRIFEVSDAENGSVTIKESQSRAADFLRRD